MLADKVRMEIYEKCIKQAVNGEVVIDVGSGTGVLSIMAARAGARRVFGIEKSRMYMKSIKDIKAQWLQDTITIYNELAEEVKLPVK